METYLCADTDVWGDSYKIAMKRMIGFPRVQMPTETMKKTVEDLFPVQAQVDFVCDTKVFKTFTADEERITSGKTEK